MNHIYPQGFEWLATLQMEIDHFIRPSLDYDHHELP